MQPQLSKSSYQSAMEVEGSPPSILREEDILEDEEAEISLRSNVKYDDDVDSSSDIDFSEYVSLFVSCCSIIKSIVICRILCQYVTSITYQSIISFC